MYCLLFFKQKTEYEMRISDWSSDVCSSDLRHLLPNPGRADFGRRAARAALPRQYPDRRGDDLSLEPGDDALHHPRLGVAGRLAVRSPGQQRDLFGDGRAWRVGGRVEIGRAHV